MKAGVKDAPSVQCVGVLLRDVAAVLKGTPLGRAHTWLLAERASVLARSTSRRLAGSHSEGSEPQASASLVPSHLPPRPEGLFGRRLRPLSRRSVARAAAKRAAWLLAEWQSTLFSFLGAGLPRSPARWFKKLGRWHVTPAQSAAFGHLVESNLTFCRLRPGLADGASRGIARYVELLSEFEKHWAGSDELAGARFTETCHTVAKPVVLDRLKLPAEAGRLDPARVLEEPFLSEYLDFEGRVQPCWDVIEWPNACYRVSEGDEAELRHMLLSSGMAVLLDASQVPRGRDGRELLSGLFCVDHKPGSDRLIFDRRPANSGEVRLNWARLPMGAQLGRILLPRGSQLRGSGDDLRTFFYQLKNLDGALGRNAFGREVRGEDVSDFGGRPGCFYRMALRVVAMGDLNAVDVAQATHLAILQKGGAMRAGTVLEYGQPLPQGDLWEGLYIDDHFVVARVRQCDLHTRRGADVDVIDSSHKAYASWDLPRAPEKGFGWSAPGGTGIEDTFTVIGTEVRSTVGTAGAPALKRAQLFAITVAALRGRGTSQALFRRNLALYIHPFMHRREFMCLFHRAFKWMGDMEPGTLCGWPPDIRDELMGAALCLPLAVAPLRWPLSTRLTATDATPDSAGATECRVSKDLIEAMFATSEQKGCYVRLDVNPLLHTYPLIPPDPLIGEMLQCMKWKSHRSYKLARRAHINLQELHEVCREAKDLADASNAPSRHINCIDSQVTLGAWAKGRSSSFPINGLLRKVLGHRVVGRKMIDNIHVCSAHNPADDPSRFAVLRQPVEPEGWMVPLLEPEAPREAGRFAGRRGARQVCEVFAGLANLTAALVRAGLVAAPLFEAFPCKQGKVQYQALLDVLCPEVAEAFAQDIRDGRFSYVHFGFPCKTWGPLACANHWTRRPGMEMGDGSLAREREGNRQLLLTVWLCYELACAGGWFSLENPAWSLAWSTTEVQDLARATGCVDVFFEQCAYGLRLPGSLPHQFCRKRTKVLGSLPDLVRLERRCPGLSEAHRHEMAWGSRRVAGARVQLATAAGAYPPGLCRAWAEAVKAGVKERDLPRRSAGLEESRRRARQAFLAMGPGA